MERDEKTVRSHYLVVCGAGAQALDEEAVAGGAGALANTLAAILYRVISTALCSLSMTSDQKDKREEQGTYLGGARYVARRKAGGSGSHGGDRQGQGEKRGGHMHLD